MKSLDSLAIKHGSCKSSLDADFARHYDLYFEPIQDSPIVLLELGVARGASLNMWNSYFTNSQKTIIGVDADTSRVKCAGTMLYNAIFTDGSPIVPEPGSYDIVIDDSSVDSSIKIKLFTQFFPKINPGGLYVIEHLQHSYLQKVSVVDFLKELLDELNMYGKAVRGNKIGPVIDLNIGYFEKYLSFMHFYPCIVFIGKEL